MSIEVNSGFMCALCVTPPSLTEQLGTHLEQGCGLNECAQMGVRTSRGIDQLLVWLLEKISEGVMQLHGQSRQFSLAHRT